MCAKQRSDSPAPFSPDISAFLAFLHRDKVRYLIVGGEAVIYYGHARLTGDVDFFYDRAPQNVRRLFAALRSFWEGDVPGIDDEAELLEPGMIVQFGVPPNRIDLLNAIDGVAFGECWPRRTDVSLTFAGRRLSVHYIGLSDLIRNKEASARDRDLDDLHYLKRLRE